MENFLLFSSLWNLKFLCTLHGNNKIFLLRFYCIWNSGNWKFASLHKLVFYTLLLHVKLKNQIASVSFLFLLSFSFRFTDNLFFFVYTSFWNIITHMISILWKLPCSYPYIFNIFILLTVITKGRLALKRTCIKYLEKNPVLIFRMLILLFA